jgi:cytoskeletal protein RodZ
LRALEEENFEALPAQTYVKGFLRTYADYLGLDGQLYVDEFNSRYAAEDEEPREPVYGPAHLDGATAAPAASNDAG